MSAYRRSTRECTFEQLRPELRDAVREYLKDNALVDEEAEIVMCCETTSERQKPSPLAIWLGEASDTLQYTGMLVTPRRLIWARSSDKAVITVVSAQLKNIRVNPFVSLLVKDTGLSVSGFLEGAPMRAGGYIGLGSELAAQKFCETVQQAVAKAKPPRSLRNLFGTQRQ